MAELRLNDTELSALRESQLSHAARLLYVLAIRPFMDHKSFIAGKARRLSYQQFKEAVEFFPVARSYSDKYEPDKSRIRRLLEELVRFGLIQRITHGKSDRRLFLKCCLASQGQIRPKYERHMSDTDERHSADQQQRDMQTNERHTENTYERHPSTYHSTYFPPIVPPTAMDWAQFFIQHGFALHEVQTAKTIPLFADWVSRSICTADMELAMVAAHAWKNGRADSPVLYGKFLETLLLQRNRKTTNQEPSSRKHKRGNDHGSDKDKAFAEKYGHIAIIRSGDILA